MADSMAPVMKNTMIVCSSVSLTFLSLRLFCKYLVAQRPGIDDITLAFSWILLIVFVSVSIYATKFGLGDHLANTDLSQLPYLLYLLPIGQFFAVISVCISKSSFIITLIRLVVLPWQKSILWFMLVTINASMFSIAIVQFYQCGDPPTQGCVDDNVVIDLGVYAAGYSAAMDLVLTAFPSLVIWKLNIKRRDKIGIIISMSLGIVAGVVGLYKTSTIPGVARNADFTYGTTFPLIWLVAEVSATIVAASIPFFRPLFRKISKPTPKGESYSMSKRSRSGVIALDSKTDQPEFGGGDDRSDKVILNTNSSQPLGGEMNITVSRTFELNEGREAPERAQRVHRDFF
ncbi:hypothetical protein BX600DRAFT_387643 [Xylariales sp. PMI_506]|nr:hypothetical protein BX600DRAFT_387643 [Xylariales sp. PMI_506]